MRTPPEPLYSEVFDLATAITSASEAEDSDAYEQAMEDLRAYYRMRLDAGLSDPFLTETLADYEDDPVLKIELYRLALAQAASVPGEPLYTKRTGLAACLIDVGERSEAKLQLDLARSEAATEHDEDQLGYIASLDSRVAV